MSARIREHSVPTNNRQHARSRASKDKGLFFALDLCNAQGECDASCVLAEAVGGWLCDSLSPLCGIRASRRRCTSNCSLAVGRSPREPWGDYDLEVVVDSSVGVDHRHAPPSGASAGGMVELQIVNRETGTARPKSSFLTPREASGVA